MELGSLSSAVQDAEDPVFYPIFCDRKRPPIVVR
jgi:hypothetical protein